MVENAFVPIPSSSVETFFPFIFGLSHTTFHNRSSFLTFLQYLEAWDTNYAD